MQISDETLMALADGELEPQAAQALREAMAGDPELAARYRRFEGSRQALAGLARASLPPAAANDPMAAMIRARMAQAAPQPAAPQAANLNRRPLLAAAASLAIAAIGLGWWGWSTRIPEGLPASELAALDSLPSGESRQMDNGAALTMIASFEAAEGAFCREYETAQDTRIRVVLACREGGEWRARFAQGSDAGPEGYQTASDEGSIEAALERIGAGAPLTPAQEAAALGIDPPV